MTDVQKVITLIKERFEPVVQNELGDLSHGFLDDADAFLAETRSDLATWSERLAKDEMSVEGFQLAVEGRAADLQVKVLADAGIAEIRIARLRSALVDAVVSAVRETLQV